MNGFNESKMIEKLMLVLSIEYFDRMDMEREFCGREKITRQELSDKLAEMTTYPDKNDIFSTYNAMLLTLDEFTEKLNN